MCADGRLCEGAGRLVLNGSQKGSCNRRINDASASIVYAPVVDLIITNRHKDLALKMNAAIRNIPVLGIEVNIHRSCQMAQFRLDGA